MPVPNKWRQKGYPHVIARAGNPLCTQALIISVSIPLETARLEFAALSTPTISRTVTGRPFSQPVLAAAAHIANGSPYLFWKIVRSFQRWVDKSSKWLLLFITEGELLLNHIGLAQTGNIQLIVGDLKAPQVSRIFTATANDALKNSRSSRRRIPMTAGTTCSFL
jgi:hypothetical protein